MLVSDQGIGAIDEPESVKRQLAKDSRTWKCPVCNLYIEPDEIKEEKQDAPTNENENGDDRPHDNGVDAAIDHLRESFDIHLEYDIPVLLLIVLIIYFMSCM